MSNRVRYGRGAPVRQHGGRSWRALLVALVCAVSAPAVLGDPALNGPGARIYHQGLLPDGQPLRGVRADGSVISGKEAACVHCHRGSGLGSVESDVLVPPVTGRALFGEGEPVIVRVDRRFNATVSAPHAPYDPAAFAALMRDGVLPGDRAAHVLMPRYALDAQALAELSAYLRTLSVHNAPGVDAQVIHLRTVIAPGVEPARVRALLDTLNALVDQHNLNVASGLRQKIPVVERRLRSRRQWRLSVHHLVGESASWAEQLDRWQEQQPAFALLSGVTSGQWQPVQDFCERRHVPCWFPSVDAVPPNAERALYSLYFSAGAALEAQAIAQHLKSAAAAPGKVVVIRGQGLVPEVTSRSLLARLQGAQAASLEQVWDVRDPVAVRDTMRTLKAHDAAVLLLSPTELAGLTALAAPASTVYLSAALAPTGLESLPAAWAARAYVVDRLERPKLRQANLKRFRFWLEARKLPLVDERLQSEAYVAATFLELTLADMLNNFHTDYLIERAEQTLSARESERSRQEVQAMMMGGGARRFVTAGEAVAHNVAPPDLADLLARQGASAYPRLSLGPGQRFASKGAYVVKWAEGADADSRAVEWIVP